MQNAGSCTWTAAYTLAYVGDNVFNAPASTPITSSSVPPGETIDVSVTLIAPTVAGTYRGDFMLVNGAGQKFGVGDGSKPFWVQIVVLTP